MVRGVVAFAQEKLKPRYIGQIGQMGDRRESFQEGWHVLAVAHHHCPLWGMRAHVDPGHGAEELLADQFPQNRKGGFESVTERHHHVVAVNVEALLRKAAFRIRQAGRNRAIGC